jgi:hypothetical protein
VTANPSPHARRHDDRSATATPTRQASRHPCRFIRAAFTHVTVRAAQARGQSVARAATGTEITASTTSTMLVTRERTRVRECIEALRRRANCKPDAPDRGAECPRQRRCPLRGCTMSRSRSLAARA